MTGTLRSRLWDHVGTAAIALVLAVIVWVNAVQQNDPPRQAFFPTPVPIEIVNLPVGLTIINDPAHETRVNIKAFESTWETLTVSNFRATVDLSGLGQGLHTVAVDVICSNPTVTILGAQPQELYIELEPLARREMEVTVRLDNQADLPLGYVLGEPRVRPLVVTVVGPASHVANVSSVVAPVNLAGRRDTIDMSVDLRAVDATGAVIDRVRLEPPTAELLLNIEQRQNYREVAVLARTTGQPARGYYVSSLEVEPATVTVVGPPGIIATMPGLVQTETPIDVTGATRTIVERANLALPEGVAVYSQTGAEDRQVLVTVDIDAVIGGTTVEVPLRARRLKEGYGVSLSVPSVDVILTGPSVVLDELVIDLIDAYVDCAGLEAGTHQLKTIIELRVEQNPQLADLVVTSISPAFVEADIRPIPGASPTPGPTVPPSRG